LPVPDARLAGLRRDLGASGGRLYLGTGTSGLALAAPQHALLVLGPPRSGKTSGLVVPNILAAPGPVLSTSTKPDVLAATAPVRAMLGRCWLLDPSGTVPVPPGVTPLRWSPVCASSSWDDALLTARAMVGAARPGGRVGEASHWTERAEALIAPLCHAAATSGGDMRTVVRWVLRQDAGPALDLLARRGATLAADVLSGLAATDGREQSGIWSTAAGVLAAYRSEAALAAASTPNFDPAALACGTDTVYVCAPAHAQALVAPIVVAFVEAVRSGTYAASARDAMAGRPPRPPVVLALDEVANIAPLPGLPSMVSEGGGQGLLTMACLQDLSQARTRWGAAADGFGSLFGTKLVLPGIADLATLDLVSRLGGEVDAPRRAVSRGPWWSPARRVPTTTWSTQRQRRLPVDAVHQQPPGSALVLSGADPPVRVGLRPWWSTVPFAPVPDATPTPGRRHRDRVPDGVGGRGGRRARRVDGPGLGG
jgi:type IV secretion system protein VirD4